MNVIGIMSIFFFNVCFFYFVYFLELIVSCISDERDILVEF